MFFHTVFVIKILPEDEIWKISKYCAKMIFICSLIFLFLIKIRFPKGVSISIKKKKNSIKNSYAKIRTNFRNTKCKPAETNGNAESLKRTLSIFWKMSFHFWNLPTADTFSVIIKSVRRTSLCTVAARTNITSRYTTVLRTWLSLLINPLTPRRTLVSPFTEISILF